LGALQLAEGLNILVILVLHFQHAPIKVDTPKLKVLTLTTVVIMRALKVPQLLSELPSSISFLLSFFLLLLVFQLLNLVLLG
jgi:uncharacterized membrane protein (Fun14 family)